MGKMTIYHGSYTIVENPEIMIEGIITRDQFWVMAKFKYPTHQINFCTKSALECLEFISGEEVTL